MSGAQTPIDLSIYHEASRRVGRRRRLSCCRNRWELARWRWAAVPAAASPSCRRLAATRGRNGASDKGRASIRVRRDSVFDVPAFLRRQEG